MVRPNRFRFFVVAIIAILIAVQQGVGAASGRIEAPAGLDPQAYIPLVQSNDPLGIHGYVTDNGSPAGSVDLDLRFFNGAVWSTRASTTTEPDGRFRFLDIAKLNPGQAYYVRFLNDNDTSHLTTWHTAVIQSYLAGTNVHIGDFDIKDIVFTSPAPGANVSVPRTFTWQKRNASPTDSYEYNLYDFNDGDPWFWTVPPLGFVGSYTLQSLPPGFQTGFLYAWFLWVYDGLGGYGISYWAWGVSFTNTGSPAGQVPASEIPMRNSATLDLSDSPIPLDLDPGN